MGLTRLYDRPASAKLDLDAILGFPETPSERRGSQISIHPLDLSAFRRHCRSLSISPPGRTLRVQVRMLHENGDWRWIDLHEQIQLILPVNARRIIAFATDITAQVELTTTARRLSSELMEAESNERRRIARELHDSVTQHLVAIDLLSSGDDQWRGPAGRKNVMEDIRSAAASGLRELRAFSYLIHPPELARFGLEGALRKFVKGFGARTGLAVELTVDDGHLGLDSAGELALFRVVQEALMNVHRHADATAVEVKLGRLGRGIVVEISDDGVGFGPGEVSRLIFTGAAGVGIAGMEARLQLLDGVLELTARDGGGLTVRAILPVPPVGSGVVGTRAEDVD